MLGSELGTASGSGLGLGLGLGLPRTPRQVLRRIALEYLLYEESGATCWDTMIDVRKRPEWLKVLGVGLWSRVATPTPTPTTTPTPTPTTTPTTTPTRNPKHRMRWQLTT